MGVYNDLPQVYVRHEESGGEAVVADEPGVLELLESRGWRRHVMPDRLDPDAPDVGVLVQPDLQEEESEPILSADEVEALKGGALAEQLEKAGLPKTGSADDKRKRLAEHEAELATPPQEGDEQ